MSMTTKRHIACSTPIRRATHFAMRATQETPVQNTSTLKNGRPEDRREKQKSWGKLSYYSSSLRPTSGMIDDPSKIASIDAASSCIACCTIFV